MELLDVPGKVALWLEFVARLMSLDGERGDTVGVEIGEGDKRLLFNPCCARMTDDLKRRIVLFDGTLWQDDEMIRLGLGPKDGAWVT